MYHNYLETIVKNKKKYVEDLISLTRDQKNHPLNIILNKKIESSQKRFAAAIKKEGLQVIAEIKRRSPALGAIKEIQNPVNQALQYFEGGAAAISVLTDKEAFGGSLEDLTQVSKALNCDQCLIPVLRKDFILHPLQLAEAVLAGSTAVLLIVSLLGNELKFMLQQVKALGLEALVEVHDEYELERALDAEAAIIGVNHRNLKTFETDLSVSARLISKIPVSTVRVAESGIHTPEQAQLMAERGFDAILVGEALSRSTNPATLITQMRGIHAD